jgi:L-threonylcarbamoyladenylate synthase
MQVSSDDIKKAVEILKTGGVVAFPTDTVYGLAALANNPPAIKRVFAIKERPPSQALPIVVSSLKQAEEAACRVPENARALMQQFWPGALTLVLEKASWVPAELTAGNDTIAVRFPNDPIAIALIEGAGSPLVGTSANKHGRNSPTNAAQVREQMDGRVDLILDGGPTSIGIESTIIDMTAHPARILRQGAISRREIENICPVE